MATQIVTADSLSVLFHESAFMEKIPEPFRGQPHVKLIVPFREYLNYITNHTPRVEVSLHMDLESIREKIDSSASEAIKCFLFDMAFAIGKEVLISQSFGLGATVILPYNEDHDDMDLSYFAELADLAYADKFSQYLSWFQMLRFPIPKPKDKWISHNQTLLKVGQVLYAYATSPYVVTVPELAYDL